MKKPRACWSAIGACLAFASCAEQNLDEVGQGTYAAQAAPALADLCGTWRAVELQAETGAPDRHRFCEPIDVRVPASIEVAAGDAQHREATLSFTATTRQNGRDVERKTTCRYKGPRGAHDDPNLLLSSCSRGLRANEVLTAQGFELALDANGRWAGPLTARTTLGDPPAPGSDAYREILGATPGLAGVSLRIPVGAAPAYSDVSLRADERFEPLDFVIDAPGGSVILGPPVYVAANAAFTGCARLTIPLDPDAAAELPAGALETQHFARVMDGFPYEDAPAESIDEGLEVDPLTGVASACIPTAGAYVNIAHDPWPMVWGGGPLMDDGVTIYFIWAGQFTVADPRPTLRSFVNDLPGSPWYEIQSTYAIGNRSVRLGQETDRSDVTGPLQDADLLDLISDAIDDGLPDDPDGIYVIVAAKDVREVNADGTDHFCGGVCGWHDTYRAEGGTVDRRWAFIGHPDTCIGTGTYCKPGYADANMPSGSAAVDSMASITAHEIVEAVTDPDLRTGWRSRATEPRPQYGDALENADKCAWRFRHVDFDPATTDFFNVEMNGHRYLIQSNWVNADEGYCAMGAESASSTATAPADGFVINEVDDFTVHVTNTGTTTWAPGTMRVRGRPEGNTTWSLGRKIGVVVRPGQTVDVAVPVQAPFEIEGNTQSVGFVFEVSEPDNHSHVLGSGTASADVRRAELLVDQAACAGVDSPDVVTDGVPFDVTVRMRNVGNTVWMPGDYTLISLPVETSNWYGLRPVSVRARIDHEGVAIFPMTLTPNIADSFDGRQTMSWVMANPAVYFLDGCTKEVVVLCADGRAQRDFYDDTDGDGVGHRYDHTGCDAGEAGGHARVTTAGDCCDSDARVYPGAPRGGAPDAGCGNLWDFACTGERVSPEVCDGLDNDANGTADDITACHSAILYLSNIDDDAFVWMGGTGGAVEDAVCSVRLADGGEGNCDLRALAAAYGNADLQRFVLKLGNGGGWSTHGTFTLDLDGVQQDLGSQADVIAHTGWVQRSEFVIDFRTGILTELTVDPCINWLDCNY